MKTPEQFEKKLIPSSNGFSPISVQRTAHETIGYNECLDKTNAKELWIENQKLKEEKRELYEALIEAKEQIEHLHEMFMETQSGQSTLVKINQALDKANK